MRVRLLLFISVISLGLFSALALASDAVHEEVHFRTDDGVVVYGDRYRLPGASATILLFHQGSSNARGEYGPIIPKLLKLGFEVVAIDQRSGGQRFGEFNRTVARAPGETSYCAAAPDLSGALKFAKRKNKDTRIILWGSSYSAALAIRLAASQPEDVAGVLAFSPASGGPMAECRGDPYFATLRTPLLILRPAAEAEVESAAAQLKLARESGHQVYIAQAGTHGSSMLVEERVGQDVAANWQVVEQYLESLVQR